MDNSGTDYFDISNGNLTIQSECTPVNYCSTSPNSFSSGAIMGFGGSTSVAANDFVLTASAATPGSFGLFFYGAGQDMAPFGDGFRCVTAGGAGIFRLGPAQLSGPLGDASRSLDLDAPPSDSGAGQISPGSTWNFQLWVPRRRGRRRRLQPLRCPECHILQLTWVDQSTTPLRVSLSRF